MSDPGDQPSITMANTPATVDAVNGVDPSLSWSVFGVYYLGQWVPAFDPVDYVGAFFEMAIQQNPFDALDYVGTFFEMSFQQMAAAQFDAVDYVGTFIKMSIQRMYPRAANYDEKIIADLPTFLETATYEDPIDDLVISFRNACLWTYSLGPDGTFWQFPLLPREIRDMIWKECVPNQKIHLVAEHVYEDEIDDRIRMRTIEIAIEDEDGLFTSDHVEETYRAIFGSPIPFGLQYRFLEARRAKPCHNRDCKPAFPTVFTQKIPFIARVSREAYDAARAYINQRIVMRHNLALVHTDMDWGIDHVAELPVWINMNTDTVLVNTKYIPVNNQPPEAVFSTVGGSLDFKSDRLFGMVDRSMVKTAIFADVLMTLPSVTYHRLTNAARIDVVVGVLQFRAMTDNEACTTDLFGMFGEESTALIPVDDTMLMSKLFNAHTAFGADYCDEFLRGGPFLRSLMWDLPRRPSDFGEYCEFVQAYADYKMRHCRRYLIEMGPVHDLIGADVRDALLDQWASDVNGTFHIFQPVFLAHRCRDSVLLDVGDLAN